MNLYQYLSKHKEVIKTLFYNGVVTDTTINNMKIYKYYLDVLEDNDKTLAICATMDAFGISSKKMYLIIAQMSTIVNDNTK